MIFKIILMKTKYLIILGIICIICFGIFFFQLGHNVETFIVFNSTEIQENTTVSGCLVDSFGRGVANKTVTYHEPGKGLVNATTDENGIFTISDIRNMPELGKENYYGDFSFAGDDVYNPSVYEYNLTF